MGRERRNNQALIQKDKRCFGQSRLDLLIGRQTKRAKCCAAVLMNEILAGSNFTALRGGCTKSAALPDRHHKGADMAAETLASLCKLVKKLAQRSRARGNSRGRG
ncbi:hypothetical protein A9K66_24975 [Mesorhizobium sp. AA23]|nr:hypothetical protein A9K66_24975 [Mesorhizobium sp. AA23]